MKKLFSLLLAACLALAISVPALAATPGLEHFTKVNTYEAGHFADIADDYWAYRGIITAYEYGFMDGMGITFDPGGSLTLAQALTIAARIHSISYGAGAISGQSGDNWYDTYLFYCEDAEIIGPANGFYGRPDAAEMNSPVTRDTFCGIMYEAVKDFIFDSVDEPLSAQFEDRDSIANAEQVGDLVQCGIIGGVMDPDTELFSFYPQNQITRAEVATVISRIVDLDLRIMPVG